MAREKICARHFDALTSAIKKKGMWHLVATSDSDADYKQRAIDWLHGKTPVGKFDPLIVATLELYKKAHDTFGMPDLCPLCAANRVYQKTDMDASWVDNVTDLMLVVCYANNLMRASRGHKVTH